MRERYFTTSWSPNVKPTFLKYRVLGVLGSQATLASNRLDHLQLNCQTNNEPRRESQDIVNTRVVPVSSPVLAST